MVVLAGGLGRRGALETVAAPKCLSTSIAARARMRAGRNKRLMAKRTNLLMHGPSARTPTRRISCGFTPNATNDRVRHPCIEHPPAHVAESAIVARRITAKPRPHLSLPVLVLATVDRMRTKRVTVYGCGNRTGYTNCDSVHHIIPYRRRSAFVHRHRSVSWCLNSITRTISASASCRSSPFL